VKAKQRGDGSATNSVVEAPSILARPTAPKEGTPVFTAKPPGGVLSSSSTARGNTGRPIASSRNEQSARGGATAAAAAGDSDAKPTQRVSTPIRTIKTAAPVEDVSDESSDDDMDDDGKVYDWTAYDTANSPMKTKLKTSSDGSMSSNGALNSSQRTMSTDKLKPPETPPPGKGTLPVRPFPDNSSADEDMYATFGGPRVEDKPVARPSKVPALAIQSPSPSAESKSYKVAGSDGKGASSPAITGASPPPRPGGKPPLNPGASSGAIPPLMTTPTKGHPPSSSQMTGGNFPSERQSSRDAIASTSVVPPLASASPTMNPSTQRRAGSHAAPPKPKTKNPHEVKETTDVKRNKAQLPAALIHAKPTAGDWLNKRYIVNNYILLDILGAGSYGEVRLCKDRLTDHLYAVKIFSKDMLRKKKGGATEETYFEDVKREIAVMKKLLHPNVLRLFEVLDDPKVNKMYLILEYMKKGDMINILKTRNGDKASDDDFNFQPLSDLELWNIFRQVAAGIRYLHYQNVVHGDIKPQNLLIGDDGVVKIADFGISKMLHASGQKLADASGTPAFMSPELFDTGKAFSGQMADIWALGATMWMLKFGNPPFIAKNIVALSNKIQNDTLVFPVDDIDPKLRDLLENMLNKDPNKRLSLQEVIMHPWMRTQPPPPVKKAAAPNDAQTGRAGSKTVNTQFQPPPSYEKDADSAMKDGVKTVTENEIFQSISGNAKVVMDAKEMEEEDVMATKWGDDVFEMVEDDGDSDSDDDSVDEDTVDSASMKGGAKGGVGNNSDNSLQNTMQTVNTVATEHSEMSQEEEVLRATRFKMSKKKSAENGLTLSQSEMLDQVPEMAKESAKSSSSSSKAEAKPTTPNREEVSSRGSNSSVSSANANSPSRGRRRGSTATGGDDDELESSTANQLTMDEFGAMMDTLALQPSKEDDADATVPLPIELSVASFSAQLRNLGNGFCAAYHSEQGQRPTQEDRCVLIPDASTLRGVDESYGEDQLEHLKKMSIACVFDGHSGWRCAQYLSQHLPTTLVGHDKFLSKQPDKALTDTCHNLDSKVGRLLRKEGDTSGCTGVIVLYDGTRKVLTVANVGDSMCVLSRGGRAVKPHKVHRLATMDVAERERIEAAGGQVINNRVDGILAVSRAFGDTAFKSESSDPNDSKVIASPDVVSEVITPMTEFAIIASDGLWDIMTPQNVVNFVRKMLSKNSDLHAAARELTQEALARGSVDNITTIIISWSGVAGESPVKKRMGKA
jgi:[calcium/calmodulin-dependent protein kinase] kinase